MPKANVGSLSPQKELKKCNLNSPELNTLITIAEILNCNGACYE